MRAAAVQLNRRRTAAATSRRAERLTRAAAADGATLVVLPERVDVRGDGDDYEAAAAPLDEHPTVQWARELARELRIDLIAGSIVRAPRGPRQAREHVASTSAPTAISRPSTARSTCSTSGRRDASTSSPTSDEAGDEIVVSELADGTRPA